MISIIGLFWLSGCDSPSSDSGNTESKAEAEAQNGLIYKSSMKLLYAKNFSVDYYEGGKRLALIRHHAELHVYEVLCPLPAHQFQHLEELAEMQVLLRGDHVEAFVEMISAGAVVRRGEIARGVQRRTVAARDEAGRHAVVVQAHDERAVADLGQSLGLELLHDGRHLVVVERLAVVAVERDAQAGVYLVHLFQHGALE